MARINLLPWRDEERTLRLNEFLFMLGGGLVAAILIAFYAHTYVEGIISHQDERNAFLDSETKKLDDQIKAIEELEKQKSSLIARMNIIQELQESRPEIVHLFDELVNTTPDGVYLTKVVQTGRTLTLEGRAQSNAVVSAYMRNIDASAWLGETTLKVIEQGEQNKGQGSYSQFTLTAQQIDKRKLQRGDNTNKTKKNPR